VCFENFLMVIHSARPQAAGTTQNNPLKTNGPKNPDPSSPRIIKDLDLYPQPPTNTHSPTLNSEEPVIGTPCKNPKYSNGCVS